MASCGRARNTRHFAMSHYLSSPGPVRKGPRGTQVYHRSEMQVHCLGALITPSYSPIATGSKKPGRPGWRNPSGTLTLRLFHAVTSENPSHSSSLRSLIRRSTSSPRLRAASQLRFNRRGLRQGCIPPWQAFGYPQATSTAEMGSSRSSSKFRLQTSRRALRPIAGSPPRPLWIGRGRESIP